MRAIYVFAFTLLLSASTALGFELSSVDKCALKIINDAPFVDGAIDVTKFLDYLKTAIPDLKPSIAVLEESAPVVIKLLLQYQYYLSRLLVAVDEMNECNDKNENLPSEQKKSFTSCVASGIVKACAWNP